MTTPSNGTTASSTRESRLFSGYHLGPGVTVNLESSASATGPFSTFASATTSRTGFTLNGSTLYPWSVNAAVPAWGTTACGTHEVFVRARSGTSSYHLWTYDSALEGNGVSGVSCLLEALADGVAVPTAAIDCSSHASPVVRLRHGEATHAGNVTISTQAQADSLACYTTIDGSLTIADDSSELHISLPYLTEVTGDVSVTYSREVTTSDYPFVRRVFTPSLTTVGGDLALHYPGNAFDIAYWELGLDAVTSTGGDVSITANTFNVTIAGLTSLLSIPGDLTVTSSGDDSELGEMLPALLNVSGDVLLQNDTTTTGALSALQSIGGDLSLEGMYLPPNAANFVSLNGVGGDLNLDDLVLITIPSFGSQFPALMAVGGTFDAESAGMTDLLIGDGAGLSLGGLRLDGMGGLTALTGTWISIDALGSVTVTNNPNLTDCQVAAYLTAIGWSGTPTLGGNGGC